MHTESVGKVANEMIYSLLFHCQFFAFICHALSTEKPSLCEKEICTQDVCLAVDRNANVEKLKDASSFSRWVCAREKNEVMLKTHLT